MTLAEMFSRRPNAHVRVAGAQRLALDMARSLGPRTEGRKALQDAD